MEPLKMNTAARIVAATLALIAAIYTVNHFMLTAKTEVYKEALSDVEERLDKLEEQAEELEEQAEEQAEEKEDQGAKPKEAIKK